MKKKIQKPTVESKLRTRVTELEEMNRQGYDAHQELLKEKREIKALLTNLLVFVKSAVQDSKSANRVMFESVRSYGAYREGRPIEELSPREMISAIQQAFFEVSKDFAREDEGTMLQSEHIKNLFEVIQLVTHDEFRPNTRGERGAILEHNLELAKKNNQLINIDHPDQFRNNN